MMKGQMGLVKKRKGLKVPRELMYYCKKNIEEAGETLVSKVLAGKHEDWGSIPNTNLR